MVLMKKTTQQFKTNTNRVREVAIISFNSNMRSREAATISINPARHTSKANASGEKDIMGT